MAARVYRQQVDRIDRQRVENQRAWKAEADQHGSGQASLKETDGREARSEAVHQSSEPRLSRVPGQRHRRRRSAPRRLPAGRCAGMVVLPASDHEESLTLSQGPSVHRLGPGVQPGRPPGREVQVLTDPFARGTIAVAFSSDGRRIAAAHYSGQAVRWDPVPAP